MRRERLSFARSRRFTLAGAETVQGYTDILNPKFGASWKTQGTQKQFVLSYREAVAAGSEAQADKNDDNDLIYYMLQTPLRGPETIRKIQIWVYGYQGAVGNSTPTVSVSVNGVVATGDASTVWTGTAGWWYHVVYGLWHRSDFFPVGTAENTPSTAFSVALKVVTLDFGTPTFSVDAAFVKLFNT